MSEKFSKAKYPELYAECVQKELAETYSEGSHRKFDWKCSNCGNVWSTELRVRTQLGCGCPQCNGGGYSSGIPRTPKIGKSLLELHPDIAEYWDYDLNSITPLDVSPGSEYRAHWECSFGHKFIRPISEQVANQHKCPYCAKGFASSFGELFIYYACVEVFGKDNVINRDTRTLGVEIDVLVPHLKIGFEYGAWHWHSNKQTADKHKISVAQEKGYKVFCIYDGCSDTASPLPKHAYCILSKTDSSEYVALGTYITNILSRYSDKELSLSDIALKAKTDMHRINIPYEKSFAFQYPDANDEWDWELNGQITPEHVFASSEQKYHFICSKGHRYMATPGHKTSRKDGCPVCANKEIRPDVNSFAAQHPSLMKYWDWTKNKENPNEISATSSKKDKWFWRCPECGEQWETSCSQTVINNSYEEQCSACRQRKSLILILDNLRFGRLLDDISILCSSIRKGDIKEDSEYREYVIDCIRRIVIENQYRISGNNKFWILETDNIYIRISKDSKAGCIHQCYIHDNPLGEKTVLTAKGKASFSNVLTTQDFSFGARHPEVLPYWDWDKNEKDPFEISDNNQALETWYWKCPECGEQWKTTRPIKNGGSNSYFCRNCSIRDKVKELYQNDELHFYNQYGNNGERYIRPNRDIMNIIYKVAFNNEGTVNMDSKSIYIQIDDCYMIIKKENGVIFSVYGVDCPEAPANTKQQKFDISKHPVNERTRK